MCRKLIHSSTTFWPAVAAAAALSISVVCAHAQGAFAAQAVGSTSAEQAVVVKVAGGGTVKTVKVLMAGNPAGDFAAGLGPSTCPNTTLPAGGTCAEYVSFTPSAPGLRMGAVVLLDSANQVLGVTFISGTGLGGLGVLVPGNLVVVAGTPGQFSGVLDGGPAVSADLNLPSSVTLDGAGNMYIADSLHNRVRMVCGATITATIAGTTCATIGNISTVAGSDNPAYTGDGGPAAGATLNMPTGVAVDGAGNLYIADTGNDVVRMIAAATGIISTVAGGASTLCAGSTDAVGDGCPATQAKLNQPWGVTLDAAGNIYIADTFNHLIRQVSSATGTITTIAGTGFTQADGSGGYNGDNIAATSAELNFPFAAAFDPQGNMYIPDAGNQRVRKVPAAGGIITPASKIVTFAGTGAQGVSPCSLATPASRATFSWPEGVAADAAGNVYIADTQNESIRKVDATTFNVTTLVQSGCGTDYVHGIFSPIDLYGPKGIFVDDKGNVYVADYYNMVVREVQGNFAAINLQNFNNPTKQGSATGPTYQEVENDGNAALDLTSITAGTNTAIEPAVTNACTTTGLLAAGADCNIGAEFAPATSPVLLGRQTESGIITAEEETQPAVAAPNNPLAIEVFGTAGPGYGTVTRIGSSPNPSTYGQTVTMIVTVMTGTAGANLGGIVTITDTYNGAAKILPGLPLSSFYGGGTSGTATYTTSMLEVGQHSLVASYSGDSVYFSSTSTDNGVAPLIQTVQPATITTLTSSLNPSTVGASVTFTAVVVSSPPGAAPDGTVTLMDGNNALGSATLADVAGAQQVTLTTSTLANGPHQITAVYGGDKANGIPGSTSNVIVQDVQAPATLSLASNLNPVYYGNNVTFTATISSQAAKAATGTVIFLDGGAQIGTGTLAGNPAVAKFTISTLALGTHPMTATYAGDSYNAAAQSQTVDQVVTWDAYSLTVTPTALTLKTTTRSTLTVSVTSVGGFSDTISFGCASLPAKVRCDFSPISVNMPANGTASVQLTIDTNNPLSGGPSAMNRAPMNRRPWVGGASLGGLLLPVGGIFGWLLWRQRRRGFGMFAVVLALAVSAAALMATGCNGFSISNAAPGTYTIQVSGTGATSYFTRHQDVTLTITQ